MPSKSALENIIDRQNARIAELEAKARTDADNIAELQQIVDSYNAFCRGVSALVVLAQQDAEIRRLRAIVDKLPKTADAVPVVPGMKLWFWCHLVPESPPHKCVPGMEWSQGSWLLDDFGPGHYFSTREAAIAASKEGGDRRGQ